MSERRQREERGRAVMCQDDLLFHGEFAPLSNHPPVVPHGHLLLPGTAHGGWQSGMGTGKREDKWGKLGGPRWLQIVGCTWEDVGIAVYLQRSVPPFEVGCFVQAKKGKGGNSMSGMFGAVEAPTLPAANSKREQ